jgi:Immunity protein family (Imm11)
MFYRLDTTCSYPSCLLESDANIGESLMTGLFVEPSTLELPWPFTMECDNDPDIAMGDFYSDCAVMSTRFVETLKQAGASNLQVFPIAITHQCTGRRIEDYCVVNVVGLVAAADLSASIARPLADQLFFEKLVIDPDAARNLPIFRLAEARSEIIVNERIAKALLSGGFIDVEIEAVSA